MINDPTIEIMIIRIMSPNSARNTLNAFDIESPNVVSSMTSITNIIITTGIKIIVIDINTPTMDAIKNVKNLFVT